MAQAGSKAVSPTVSVYLGDDLATRVAQAKEAGLFEPKEICKGALERALAGDRSDIPDSQDVPNDNDLVTRNADLEAVVGRWQEIWTEIVRILDLPMASVGQRAVDEVLGAIRELKENPLSIVNLVAEPISGGVALAFSRGPETDFKLSWSDDEEQLVNRLQLLQDSGAWPVSIAVGPDGRLLMLAAWPTE